MLCESKKLTKFTFVNKKVVFQYFGYENRIFYPLRLKKSYFSIYSIPELNS